MAKPPKKFAKVPPEPSYFWREPTIVQTWHWVRMNMANFGEFFCKPAREKNFNMRKAELAFINESAHLGNVIFYEDIRRWAPGDLTNKLIAKYEKDGFIVVKCDNDGLRLCNRALALCSGVSYGCHCEKHEEFTHREESVPPLQEMTVSEVLKWTGATMRDFEVSGTPDDDITSMRARQRATEFARVGLVEKGVVVKSDNCTSDHDAESFGNGYWDVDKLRPPGRLEIKLPHPFDDSVLIASSTPLSAMLNTGAPDVEIAKQVRGLQDTLEIARKMFCKQKEDYHELKEQLSDKTMLLEQQAKELQKTQQELAELTDAAQHAIKEIGRHPQLSQASNKSVAALPRQLGQRVGAVVRHLDNDAKIKKKLDVALQKHDATEQKLRDARKAADLYAAEAKNMKTANEILQAEVADLQAPNGELEASKAQLDELERLVECVVCKDRHVEVVFHCGHTTCAPCGERLDLNDDPCPTCHQKLGYRKRLYLGS